MYKDVPVKLTKHTPCREATVELRFNSDIPAEAIIGIVYQKLKGQGYTAPKSLPIMQLPENIRKVDTNLRFAPYFIIGKGDIQISLGPRVLAIIHKGIYNGWSEYYNETNDVISSLSEISLFKNISRIAVRYINFFDKKDNLFNEKDLDFEVKMPFESNSANTSYSSIIQCDNYLSLLKVQLDCEIIINNLKTSGTLIDIDTFQEYKDDVFSEFQIKDKIIKAHNIEKKIFFNLLKKDFVVNKLGGIYG